MTEDFVCGITLYQYCGDSTEVVIPAELNGIEVWALGAGAFRENRRIEQVRFEWGIKVIGENAFTGCMCLRKVFFPESLYEIEEEAFRGCVSLTEIKLSNLIVKERAFINCPELKKVIVTRGVSSIKPYALGYCGNPLRGYEFKKVEGFKIYCHANTAGERYAVENGFDYELID